MNQRRSGKKDTDPERTTVPCESRKTTERKTTIGESNVKEAATIDTTLRLQGGLKNDESIASARIPEERQVKRRTSEPCSEISGIEEVKLSDVTEHMKKEVYSASKISDERTEKMMQKKRCIKNIG